MQPSDEPERSAPRLLLAAVALVLLIVAAVMGMMAWSAGVDRLDLLADPVWVGGTDPAALSVWR